MTSPWRATAMRVSRWNRERKWLRFMEALHPDESTTVLDVGFSDREYHDVDNYLEKRYPWPRQVTAVGIDEPVEFKERYPEVTAVRYDGVTLPFPDGSFDIVWSNAVVEHVGGRERQVEFLRELARVGRALYLTTPDRAFPIEVHTRLPFAHWLPRPAFDAVARATGRAWATGDYMHLLTARSLRAALRDAGIGGYRILCNRFGPATIDFSVVVEHTGEEGRP